MKTYYVIGLDEDHKPEHTMKIVSRVPVTMDNVSMAFKQLYPNVVIAQEVSGMGVAVCSEKSEIQAALDELINTYCQEDTKFLRTKIIDYSDYPNEGCEHLENMCILINKMRKHLIEYRAALTAQDVNAELLEALKDLQEKTISMISHVNIGGDIVVNFKPCIDRVNKAISRAEQKGGV